MIWIKFENNCFADKDFTLKAEILLKKSHKIQDIIIV